MPGCRQRGASGCDGPRNAAARELRIDLDECHENVHVDRRAELEYAQILPAHGDREGRRSCATGAGRLEWKAVPSCDPVVSVVIPAFNAEPHLRETLDCVLSQSLHAIEILFVDDGSTDGTLEIARSYGDRLRVFTHANHGVSYSRNVGLAHCCGEYVHFMDADDLLSPDFYERLLEPLVADPGLDAAFCAEESFEGEWASRTVLWHTDKSEYDSGLYRTILLRSNLSPANVLYRRSSMAFVGGFDLSLRAAEDYDFQLRFARFCLMQRVPEAVYYYRRHPASASRNYEVVYRSRLAVAKRHITAFEGMRHWRREWRELRRACAVEACATIRFNLKKSARDWSALRRELSKAARFLLSAPSVALRLLSGRHRGDR